MGDPPGEADRGVLRLDFDRRLLLQFRGSSITSDAGLLAYRELDDTLDLTDTGAETLADARTGKNGRHRLTGLLRQSVFGRLAGYEDVNDCIPRAAGCRHRGGPRHLQPAGWGHRGPSALLNSGVEPATQPPQPESSLEEAVGKRRRNKPVQAWRARAIQLDN